MGKKKQIKAQNTAYNVYKGQSLVEKAALKVAKAIIKLTASITRYFLGTINRLQGKKQRVLLQQPHKVCEIRKPLLHSS